MSVKSKYYQLSNEEFDKYLKGLKESNQKIEFLTWSNKTLFYIPSIETNNNIIELNTLLFIFDNLINSFSNFAKRQIIQSYLIDEIESTNLIESIYSTKHDIFAIINNINDIKYKKIKSIINAYKMLIESNSYNVNTLEDIKTIYSLLLKDAVEKEDLPDGKFFRKSHVEISDGVETIHNGLHNEENINKGMDEFIQLLNNSSLNILERLILSHYLIEYIHPYYDGNGRLGRYLFSLTIFKETNSYYAFLIAKSFKESINSYYKSFKDANDIHEFGSLNEFVLNISNILIKQLKYEIKTLNDKKNLVNNNQVEQSLTKKENSIYTLLKEASLFSYYGISNNEIIKELNISKRTLMYALEHFKELNILEDTKIGRITYHKIKD